MTGRRTRTMRDPRKAPSGATIMANVSCEFASRVVQVTPTMSIGQVNAAG